MQTTRRHLRWQLWLFLGVFLLVFVAIVQSVRAETPELDASIVQTPFVLPPQLGGNLPHNNVQMAQVSTAAAAATCDLIYSDLAPSLTIDATNISHDIDAHIYGIKDVTPTEAFAWRVPLNRWGGNPMSRYNWENDAYNTGDWWYFTNQNFPDMGTLPDNSLADQWVQANIDANSDSLLQIPMVGYVPKNRDKDCGFAVAKYGWQEDVESWGICGNGKFTNGENIVGNNPLDTSIFVDETFAAGWINHLTGRYGNAANGGVAYYSLDNEPMLWSFNHRDVHPTASTYDYVTEKGIRYAEAIKGADSSAEVMGPGVWGWQPYYYSGYDIEAYWGDGPDAFTFPDYEAHGNKPFLAWYLQEFQNHANANNGERILDYIDIHAYPQIYTSGGWLLALGPAGNANDQAMRLCSTRELWDPNWQPQSWVPEPIYAIRLMHDWIGENYPGTKVAISEYSWGANEHINGALAQADVFGIFGREELSVGALFDPPELGQPVDYAIRMYRNYNGVGGHFGNKSVEAVSANDFAVSVFAAKRTADNQLTVMVINKSYAAQTSNVSIIGDIRGDAKVYRYSMANPNNIVLLPEQALDANQSFAETFPQESITLYVFPIDKEPTGNPHANVILDKFIMLPLVVH